jgi:hypothetical protein
MRERNPKDFFEHRKAQLKDATPLIGKLRRKKVIEEICNSKFDGFYQEKIAAILEGLVSPDPDVRKIATDYLLNLENPAQKELVMALCESFLDNQNPRVLHIIRKKKFMPKFTSIYKTIEFYSAIYGVETTKKAVERLSLDEALNVLINTSNEDLKKIIIEKLNQSVTKKDLLKVLDYFKRNPHYSICQFVEKFFDQMNFKEKVLYIQYVPAMRGFEGNKEDYTKELLNKLDQSIKENPDSLDSNFALTEYEKNPYNHWLLDILKNNRNILGIKNELVLCNYFKEYKKVREIINTFTLEQLCEYFPYFVGTPMDCMFQQKIRAYIKKQNYKFDFYILKDFFQYLEENLKMDIFRMLSNYSEPTYLGFLLYQMDKITTYSTDEQKIYIHELVPYYIPMFFRLPEEKQFHLINNLPDMDFAALDFFVNMFLKMRQEELLIDFLEKMIKATKFSNDERAVIIEIILNQKPHLIEKSTILTEQKTLLINRAEKLRKLLIELEKQCSRRYIQDDTTGHNEEIDRKRALLRKEIQKIDIEKAIEILLPHYDEKNYRLKKDVKIILENTQVGYKYLIPYAFTDAIKDKDLRDFAVELMEKRIQPYVPFKPDIHMTYDNYKYVEFFLSEQEPTFKNLARLIRKCNIVVKK